MSIIIWCELQVKRNIDLVYGGGSVGLMGLISQRVYDGGCHVLGYVHKKKKKKNFLVLLTIDYIVSSFVCFYFTFYPHSTYRIIPKALMPLEVFVPPP